MAACGGSGGLILDISKGIPRRFESLAGKVLAFSADSNNVFVAKSSIQEERTGSLAGKPGARRPERKQSLDVVGLSGRIIRSFALEMSVPEIIEVPPDGASITVAGMDGNPRMHVPRMCTVKQTIDLGDGESSIDRGPVVRGRPRDRDKPVRHKLIPCNRKRTAGQRLDEFHWDERSGICVMKGSGMPEGGVHKAWRVRKARFLSTLGGGNWIDGIGGFLSPGVVTASSYRNRKRRLTTIDLLKGERTDTDIEGRMSLPSPTGTHVAAIAGRPTSPTGALTVWELGGRTSLFSIKAVPFHRPPQWSADGSFLMHVAVEKEENRFALELHHVDGKATDRLFPPDRTAGEEPELSQQELRMAERMGIKRDALLKMKRERSEQDAWLRTRIWDVDSDSRSKRIALAVGCGPGRAVVVDPVTKASVAEFGGIPGGAGTVRFVSDRTILVGGRKGRVALWDYRNDTVLWTVETGEGVVQFGFAPGSNFVVCQHTFRSATVLDMRDGGTVRRTPPLRSSGTFSKLPWTNPLLVSNGSITLEAVPGSFQVRLVETASARTIVILCPFADDQWIVYLPDGRWDGSPDVHDWVKWYRGPTPLERNEAERLRDRDAIRSAVRRAFGMDGD